MIKKKIDILDPVIIALGLMLLIIILNIFGIRPYSITESCSSNIINSRVNDVDYNDDGKINCKDIQMQVYQCYKGKKYYVQNCRSENSTDAHAWVKVWINYIPLVDGIDTCKDCITDVYGDCII